MMRAANKHSDGIQVRTTLPSAIVKKSRLTWWLWGIPVAAAALCLWFLYRDFVATGPMITIYFKDAEGLEDQEVDIRYRGATIGEVKHVALTREAGRVAVRARLIGPAADLAREGTIFWIVRPEVKIGAISGLSTIITGDYIDTLPGDGPRTNEFVGAEKEPTAPDPGSLEIELLIPDIGSLEEGSPIIYRGIEVGEVLYYQLGANAQNVVVHARVSKPYAPLVRMDSKFWNAGGVDFRLGLFKGVRISAESARTLVGGGIEFATPTQFQAPATNGTVFIINDKADDKWKFWSPVIPLQLPRKAPSTNGPVPVDAYLNKLK